MEYPGKENPSDKETHPLARRIAQELGHIGAEQYSNLPRKTKKAAKKVKQGRSLTQQELSRLAAIRKRQN
jgi:hypothetical protein